MDGQTDGQTEGLVQINVPCIEVRNGGQLHLEPLFDLEIIEQVVHIAFHAYRKYTNHILLSCSWLPSNMQTPPPPPGES